jgi:shikimate dehydrogenase
MTSNVQPVVCCLGYPVAGNPTQFLMQRASEALGLDWTFVTAEVTTDKVAEAFQGIRALHFSGAALLPPHRPLGSRLVDSTTESAWRSGQVRVARRDGDSWLGDDTLGQAIVEILRFEGAVVEESSRVAVSGRSWLPDLLRIACPEPWKARLIEAVPVHDELPPPPMAVSPLASEEATASPPETVASASIERWEYEQIGEHGCPIEVMIVDAEAKAPSGKQLSKVRWTAAPTLVMLEPNPRWEAAIQSLKLSNLRILRSTDIAAAKAMVNFQFWTGHLPDLSLMRDALDEYCQW